MSINPNILSKEAEDDSPCLDCPHRDMEGKKCALLCLRLAAHSSGQPWQDKPLPYIAKQKTKKKKAVKMEEETETGDQTCIMPGCNEPVKIRSLCQIHYDSWRQGFIEHPELGVFLTTNKSVEKGICLIDKCDEPAKVQGLCSPHYQAWRKGFIKHPVKGDFTLSQIHHRSKIKTSPGKPKPETIKTKDNPKPKCSYPSPDFVTLDFANYPELKAIIFERADESLLPIEHVVFSILAGAIAARKKREDSFKPGAVV